MALVLFYAFASILVLFTCKVLRELRRKWTKELLPGPITFPIIGSLPQLIVKGETNILSIYKNLAAKYGNILGIQIGMKYIVLITDLEIMKEVSGIDDWLRLTDGNKIFDEMTFNKKYGLLLNDGESWKEIRRYTIRSLARFGFGKSKSMEVFIDEEFKTFEKRLEEDFKKDGNCMEMKGKWSLSMTNILWGMIAGIRFPESEGSLKQLLSLISNVTKVAQSKSLIFIFPFLAIFPNVTEREKMIDAYTRFQIFFRNVIEERRESKSYENPADFIDAFLYEIEQRKGKREKHAELYTDEQLIMVCVDLLVAGGDTTGNELDFAFTHMIRNPKVQAKVQEEIDAVVGCSRDVSLDDKSRMPYTEAATLEIFRSSPTVPIFVRSPKNDSKFKGYDIPKNSYILMNMHGHLNSERVWGDPYNFRPERFLNENNEIDEGQRDKVLAFGINKKTCIGETLARGAFFIFFTRILQRFNVSRSPEHPMPSIIPVPGSTFSTQPFHAILTLRSS